MSRSLRVDFLPGGKLSLSTTEAVSGAQAGARNACINLLSSAGEDPIFPERGTDLGWRSFQSSLLTFLGDGSLAKFAASDTLFFLRENLVADPEDKPDQITLIPVAVGPTSVDLKFSYTTTDGRVLSYPLPT